MSMTSPSEIAESQHRKERAMGIMIVIVSFLALYNAVALNVAIPEFLRFFDASVSAVQWIGIGYTLVMGVVSPLAGYFARALTLRRYFIISIILFTVFSLLSGFTNSIYVLIVIRSLQGLAGVALIPTTMMAIYQYIPRHKQPFFLTVQNMSLSLGPAIGPVIVGMLITVASWRWIFWFNVPLGALAIFLGMRSLPKEKAVKKIHVDFPSLFYAIFGCFPILLAFSLSLNWGFFSPRILSMLVGGSILVFLFVRRQLRLDQPILDFSILNNREYTIALIGNVLISMALALGPFVFAVYFQMVQGYTPFEYGLILLFPAIFSIGGAPIAQMLYTRWSSKKLILFAWLFLAGGSIALSFLKADTILMVSIGFVCFRYLGIGLMGMPITDHGMRELSSEKSDDGSTLINWSKLMMTSFSLSIFTLLYEVVVAKYEMTASSIEAMVHGVDIIFLTSGIACILGMLLSLKMKKIVPENN